MKPPRYAFLYELCHFRYSELLSFTLSSGGGKGVAHTAPVAWDLSSSRSRDGEFNRPWNSARLFTRSIRLPRDTLLMLMDSSQLEIREAYIGHVHTWMFKFDRDISVAKHSMLCNRRILEINGEFDIKLSLVAESTVVRWNKRRGRRGRKENEDAEVSGKFPI